MIHFFLLLALVCLSLSHHFSTPHWSSLSGMSTTNSSVSLPALIQCPPGSGTQADQLNFLLYCNFWFCSSFLLHKSLCCRNVYDVLRWRALCCRCLVLWEGICADGSNFTVEVDLRRGAYLLDYCLEKLTSVYQKCSSQRSFNALTSTV